MKKKLGILLTAFAMISCLGGCELKIGAQDEVTKGPRPVYNEMGEVQGQTSELGISTSDPEFASKLQSGKFYVVQDGVYYPLVYGYTNESEPGESAPNPRMQWYFTIEAEQYIPTLYDDCELMYYSKGGLLDYMVWRRFYDMGYSIGIHEIKTLTNGRKYIRTDADSEQAIIPGNDLYNVYNYEIDSLLLDKIGGVEIVGDMVEEGMLTGLSRGKNYDLEVYNGTYFQHFNMNCNMHAFKEYELYASIEYETLQNYLYRIEIPDYLVSGYYTVNGAGMFRLVRGNSFNEETDFNEQVLFPYVNENAYDSNSYVAPGMYSTYAPLNQFRTNVPGTLGYADSEILAEDGGVASDGGSVIREATIKEIELWFPKGETAEITIVSPSGETTGDIYVLIEDTQRNITYSRLEDVYSGTIKGKDQRGTLVISGLFRNYEIQLVGCQQYRGQDSLEEEQDDTFQESEALEQSILKDPASKEDTQASSLPTE